MAVCPTGIDIRNGPQMECIQCGLCIDACDNVMTKIGRPKRLIGYDNDVNIQRRQEGKAPIYRIVRARTVSYSAIIAAVGGIMIYTLATRSLLDVNVLHDRNPVAVRLSDGSIRNAYTVRLLNKSGYDRVIAIDASGPVNATIHVIGIDFCDAGPADDRGSARLHQRAAAARDRSGGGQSGKVHPGSLSRHRYRPRRSRQRHRQFRRALGSGVRHGNQAADRIKSVSDAGRLLRRRDRRQRDHDEARDRDAARNGRRQPLCRGPHL
ncbi:ferredoxin [Bradyrhizobium sp. GM6.1]